MNRREPLPQETRDAIAAAIQRDPTPPVRELCDEFDVAKATIYRIAREYGLSNAWEDRRARTEAATATKAADLAAKRQRLEELALDAATEYLHKRHDPHHVVEKGIDGVQVLEVPPGPHEAKAIGQAVQSLSNSAIGFARLASELSSAGQASGLLEQFEASLRQARHDRERASREGTDE